MNAYLSKSHYIKGLQCHKALWLQKYQPELKDEVPESLQAVFDSGTNVGILAQELFPGGLLVPYEGLTHQEQIEATRKAIDDGVETIYEAAFSHNDIFIKADIIHKGTAGWELYEVKSSTGLKDVYIEDIAVQYFVIAGSGLSLSKACLVHINNQYVRHGAVDVRQLFTILGVTEEIISLQGHVRDAVAGMQDMLTKAIPAIDIGPYCDKPYECDFKGHCWAHIPSPSAFDFRGHGKPRAFPLYEKGIVRMEDVPVDVLGWRQKLQLEGYMHHKNHCDVAAVKDFLDSLWYPLCFMDFETYFQESVPLYDGTRPFQQVPFQFSLHTLLEPGDELQHVEYLADGTINPQGEFLEKLLAAMPQNACILVWNQTFEAGRLKELSAMFPEKATAIEGLISNIRDLMIPFRNKSIYNWQFNGSYSIKHVLPALAAELSYDNLEIREGATAASEWLRMIRTNDKTEKSLIRQNLLEYCKMDTYAEVRILEEMRKMTET